MSTEELQQQISDLDRKLQMLTVPAGLQQFEYCIEQERMVIEIRLKARTSVFVSRVELTVRIELRTHEVQRLRGRSIPWRASASASTAST